MKTLLQLLTTLLSLLLLSACYIAPRPAIPRTPAPSPTASPPPTKTPLPTLTPPLRPTRPLATATIKPTLALPSPTPTATLFPTPGAVSPVTIGVVGKLSSLNPLLDLNPALQRISPLLYASLGKIDPLTAEIRPGLADIPAVSADGLTLTYTLRANSALSPVDAQASIEAAVWPELADIRWVRQTGSHTLTVELLQANCGLLDTLARLPILRQRDVFSDTPEASIPPPLREGQGEGENPAERQAAPDAESDLDDGVSPTPSPTLSLKEGGRVLRLFDDEASLLAALQAGEVDRAYLRQKPPSLPNGCQFEPAPSPFVALITFNNQEAPFDNAAVRRALSLAVDREKVLQQAFDGAGDLATGFLPPTHYAADATLAPPKYAPDAAARQLDKVGLRDADGDGWRELPDSDEIWQVTIRANRDNAAETKTALLIADALRKIGVRARAEIVTFPTILDDLTRRDYQLIVYTLPLPPDLDWRAYFHSAAINTEFGLNLPAYSNPQVDAWLDAANALPHCERAERIRLYQKIQAQLAQDRPVDFLIRPYNFVVSGEKE